jgi:hypothetical protein
MKKQNPSPLLGVVFAWLLLSFGGAVFAQTADFSATVQFSNGQSITTSDFSDPIGIQPGELINVTLQFSAEEIGQPVVIEAPDGGSTSIGAVIPVVNNDGTLSFAFLAPATTGTKSIGIRSGTTTWSLAFSVANASRP